MKTIADDLASALVIVTYGIAVLCAAIAAFSGAA